jgi:hypothetical protein
MVGTKPDTMAMVIYLLRYSVKCMDVNYCHVCQDGGAFCKSSRGHDDSFVLGQRQALVCIACAEELRCVV